MSIKQTLSKFYVAQGLTGKHLRKALQWDMRQVRKHTAAFNPPGNRSWDTLFLAFPWSYTPEGGRYWCARSSW